MATCSVFDLAVIRTDFEDAGIGTHFISIIWKKKIHSSEPDAPVHEEPSLPSVAYPLLRSTLRSVTSSVDSAADSAGQVTTKLLIKLQSGSCVEAVIMRYDTRLGKYAGKPRLGGPRSTLCLSSQVGCKFCATGSMGIKSNLTSGGIVEQLVHAYPFSRIHNIVVMGMGEPLNNYSAVVEAIRVMTRSPVLLSPKRITVSTKILIKYIMLDGINDEEKHAHQLGELLASLEVVVNLILFNPIGTLSQYRTSTEEAVVKFQKVLRGNFNMRTTVRKQIGRDISGACGQLVVNLSERMARMTSSVVTDIEDLHI